MKLKESKIKYVATPHTKISNNYPEPSPLKLANPQPPDTVHHITSNPTGTHPVWTDDADMIDDSVTKATKSKWRDQKEGKAGKGRGWFTACRQYLCMSYVSNLG